MASTDRRRRRRARPVAGLALLVVVAGGCSSDDATVDALSARLAAVESSPLATSSEARCVAERVAGSLALDRSESVETAGFSDEELILIGQAATLCADTAQVVLEVLGDVYAPEDAACIHEHVADTFSQRTIGAVVIGTDPIAYEGFFEAVADTSADCPGVEL